MGKWINIEKQPKFFIFSKEGDMIEGVYRGYKENETFGNKIFFIEFNNDEYSIFSTTMLERLMSKVKIDDYVRITFLGTKKLKNRKSPLKLFRVEILKND